MKEQKGYTMIPRRDGDEHRGDYAWGCVACYFAGVFTAVIAGAYIALTMS